MDVEIRGIEPEEWERWYAVVASAFSEYPNREWMAYERKVAEYDRTLAALDGSRMVAGLSALSLRVTVPGGVTPLAGVTGLGVAPTHRRRGLASALMHRHLEEVRERGEETLSGLWASESHIYPRFGYGVAAPRHDMEIEKERSAFSFPHQERGRVRLLERAEALVAFGTIYERVRPEVPGMLERSDEWWDLRFGDPESEREGWSAFFYALHEAPEGPDAYAVYRHKGEWSRGVPAGEIQVEELVASTPEGYAGMWRFLFDTDLVAKISSWNRPVDEPLWYMVAEPRRLRLRLRDGLWLRLVDVQAALSARRYGVDGSLTFEVRDGFCPWNDGRYRLEGGPDGSSCYRVDTEPDIVVGVEQLSAAYLGWPQFGAMLRAGRLVEGTPAAVARADSMFAHDPAPWCPHAF